MVLESASRVRGFGKLAGDVRMAPIATIAIYAQKMNSNIERRQKLQLCAWGLNDLVSQPGRP
jgi:hypothetical protein